MRIGIDARKIGDFGIGTYIRGLLGGLARHAGEDDFVVLAPPEARPLIPRTFHHLVVDAPHYSVRELWVIGSAARRADLDLLHVPHYVVPLTSIPLVVTIHDLIHLHQPHRNPVARPYARMMLARAVRKSAHLLTVSEAVKKEIVETFRCPESKVTVTPNGIDERFRAAEPNAAPGRYFLYAGNDKPHKNVDRLVSAFAVVRSRHPEVTLLLVGSAFERHQREPGVVTPGFVGEEELAALYRGALAVVQPSLEEGFGLPAAEAMAAGAAVITSTAPALVEITGEAALHADGRSVEALAEAMTRIAGDEALRLLLARRGIERSRSLTWDRCAASTLQRYRAL